MLGIIEKNVILIASLMAYIMIYGLDFSRIEGAVLIFLISLIITEFTVYLNNRKIRLIILVLFIIMSFINWQFIFFIPVVVYFLIEEKVYNGFFILFLYVFLYIKTDSVEVIFSEISICILSALLSYENMQAQKYKKKYLETRDSSTELENKLKCKNRELLESQDLCISNATLKERNRIAREIHDNVGHMLSRTILQTAALMTIYKEETLHEQIQSINTSLNEAMNNIRESVHDLHDESVDLKLSILEIIKPLKKEYVIDFDYDMSDKASRNVKYCFISIIKEATANIVKHSSASNIYILVREHPGFYQLAVEDNGKEKIDMEHAGIGLANMHDRVEGLMGNISISDKNGFKIRVSIPKTGE